MKPGDVVELEGMQGEFVGLALQEDDLVAAIKIPGMKFFFLVHPSRVDMLCKKCEGDLEQWGTDCQR